VRADEVVLTYDPRDRTLRADGHDTLSVTVGKNADSRTTKGGLNRRETEKHPPQPEAERG
jgi:hypothetical protein